MKVIKNIFLSFCFSKATTTPNKLTILKTELHQSFLIYLSVRKKKKTKIKTAVNFEKLH